MLDVADLHPKLAEKVLELERLAKAEGFPIFKNSGARSFKEQATLYSLFKHDKYPRPVAPAGLSRHHRFFNGLSGAVDLDTDLKLRAEDDPKQIRLGELGESIGLVWGGRFSVPDVVHFELPGLDPYAEYVSLMGRLDELVDKD